jgi:signal transduction histidine kinase/CheY-like chemotaxis protein
MSVIVASDDLATRQALNVVLRKYDRHVELVATVDEVLAACRAEAAPEKIILDTKLSIEDPVSLLERVTTSPGHPKPVVFLLTHDQDGIVHTDISPLHAGSLVFGGLADLEAEFQSGYTANQFGQRLSVEQVRLGSEDEFMAVFLHAPIPIYLIDTKGQVQRANLAKNPHISAAGESSRDIGYVLGCVHAEESGRCGKARECDTCSLHRVIHDTIRENRCFHRKEITLSASAREEDQVEQEYALASTTPLWIGKKKMILLFLEDITELRRSQEQLAEFNRNLEDLVSQRTEEVRALLEQKKEFIRQLGHDLRTPLTPLVGLLPMFRTRLTEPKDREMLEVIISNTEYIRQLVAKTLDLMVLENDQVTPDLQAVDLHVEINNILADFKTMQKDKQFTATSEIESQTRIRVDVIQFKELLLNLLTNAVKFSPPDGYITVRAARRNDEVVVSVTDTGVGMDQEHLTRIFDEFYKVDSSRHDRKSLGLGLSICRRIVENHHGRIWAESPGVHQGTTISFALPAVSLSTAGHGESAT